MGVKRIVIAGPASAEAFLQKLALTVTSAVADVDLQLAALIRDDVVLGEDQSLAAAGV